MPLQATSGAASYDAFGGGVPVPKNYIEDVFSTYLYTGNGSTQTITNGIDLSTKGGMVWQKDRVSPNGSNTIVDSQVGITKVRLTESTAADMTMTTGAMSSFNTDGYSMAGNFGGLTNRLNDATVAWTFRKQPKFFDVVTWTGNGSVPRSIPHSLASVPGCIITKCTSSSGPWITRHQSAGDPTNDMTQYATNSYLDLQRTIPADGSSNMKADATNITVNHIGDLNANGATYVAYLFAHNAGGFGLSGTDNVISCGSYTGNGSVTGPVVSLGYEPQWLIIKNAGGTGNWQMIDNMRGMPVGSADATLQANLSNAESSVDYVSPTATGFQITSSSSEVNTSGNTYIYIAIRRGPMKVPTTGTSVFGLNARTGNDVNTTVTGGQTDDLAVIKVRAVLTQGSLWTTRLTSNKTLLSSSTAVESTASTAVLQTNPWDVMDGVKVGAGGTTTNNSSATYINWLFKRAPNFYDTVCYTGSGANRTVSHNLGAVPELIIVKQRSDSQNWFVYNAASGNTKYTMLNSTAAAATLSTAWNDTSPTSSVFTVGTAAAVNTNNGTYIAHLFATCAGVSKVGSYTGDGSSQTINCGFTSGARFVLIKRTDSTGDWYVWDTARGIVAGNDPHLSLNTTVAEVTTDDTIDTDSTGFVVNQVSATNVNVSSATYIFLAIA